MQLLLKSSDTIQHIQEHFTSTFRFLKLEFYHKKHSVGDKDMMEDQFRHDVTLKELLGHEEDILLQLEPSMRTNELEMLFEEKFNLHVQIMRKQGGVWLQTTRSDNQTLEEQNQHGEDMDAFLHSKPEEA